MNYSTFPQWLYLERDHVYHCCSYLSAVCESSERAKQLAQQTSVVACGIWCSWGSKKKFKSPNHNSTYKNAAKSAVVLWLKCNAIIVRTFTTVRRIGWLQHDRHQLQCCCRIISKKVVNSTSKLVHVIYTQFHKLDKNRAKGDSMCVRGRGKENKWKKEERRRTSRDRDNVITLLQLVKHRKHRLQWCSCQKEDKQTKNVGKKLSQGERREGESKFHYDTLDVSNTWSVSLTSVASSLSVLMKAKL